MVPWAGLLFVIVAFLGHTHSLFFNCVFFYVQMNHLIEIVLFRTQSICFL